MLKFRDQLSRLREIKIIKMGKMAQLDYILMASSILSRKIFSPKIGQKRNLNRLQTSYVRLIWRITMYRISCQRPHRKMIDLLAVVTRNLSTYKTKDEATTTRHLILTFSCLMRNPLGKILRISAEAMISLGILRGPRLFQRVGGLSEGMRAAPNIRKAVEPAATGPGWLELISRDSSEYHLATLTYNN